MHRHECHGNSGILMISFDYSFCQVGMNVQHTTLIILKAKNWVKEFEFFWDLLPHNVKVYIEAQKYTYTPTDI